MELSPHICKSSTACAHEKDDIKQTRTTRWIIYCTLDGVELKIYKSIKVNYKFGGVHGKIQVMYVWVTATVSQCC